MPGIFSQYDTQDLNRIAAKGILNKLKNIRQQIKEDFTARRLLWELIQNAKDNAATCDINSKVKIVIEIKTDQLSFIHNKGYFTNENIRTLIRCFSSSEKVNVSDLSPFITGRFGTGFMTTHLLSEKVCVKGFFQENEKLCCKFELPLDRTGQTEEEIIQSIEQSVSVFEESISKSKKFAISSAPNFSTLFRYDLDDEGYKLAKISISEFEACVAYTLINVPNIEKISVKQDGEIHFYKIGKKIEYQTEKPVPVIEIIEVKSDNCNFTQKHFATICDDNTRIIIPVRYSKEKIEILNLKNNIPRLFLDFPMIGTEELNIPFVINDPNFEPTEPRDGVSLTGKDNKDTRINGNILIKAFDLFKVFIDYSSRQSKWTRLYNLARIEGPSEREWLDQKWFNEKCIEPIREHLLQASIVDVVGGDRVSIIKDKATVDFPHHSKKEIREGIWELCNLDKCSILPLQEHIHEWYNIIWDKKYHLNLDAIMSWTQCQEKLVALEQKLQCKGITPIDWLNNLYKLAGDDKDAQLEITQDRVKIIPNQLGELCSLKDLSIDDDIDEKLKDIATQLGYDVRKELLDKEVVLESPKNRIKNQEQIAGEISKLINPVLKDPTKREEKKNIMQKLYLWMCDNSSIAKQIFDGLYEKRFLLLSDDEIKANIEKAKKFDEIINETGLTPEEIKEKLIADTLLPISLLLSDGSSEKSRISVSEEAKDIIFQALKNEGFDLDREDIKISNTIVTGIINPEGKRLNKLIAKSAKGGKIYFNPSEWLAFTEPHSQLFVVTKGNEVRNITLSDIESVNDTFHMRFNTQAFAVDTNLKAFADFFKYLPDTHFIFDTPESTTSYLQPFGLNERNPSSEELTPDDKNNLR